jgi:7-cyano-7-deazaguanine synthase
MIVLLFSGGLDSTTLAHMALDRGEGLVCLFVRYGQPAAPQEYDAAERWCRKHGVTLCDRVLSDIHLADMAGPNGQPGPRFVPGRNLLLIAHAVNLAVAVGADRVWYGAQGGDHAMYPDCRPSFVDAVATAARLSDGIALEAPLSHYSRGDVRELAARLGVVDTWSCYTPINGEPCGTCGSCHKDGGSSE